MPVSRNKRSRRDPGKEVDTVQKQKNTGRSFRWTACLLALALTLLLSLCAGVAPESSAAAVEDVIFRRTISVFSR